jgi:hypothetical protein
MLTKDGRIISKVILKNDKVWTGITWPRIGSSEHRMNLRVHERGKIS